jgi:hypothetical protein
MDFIEELDISFRSRFTLICIQSYEEERVLEQIKALCDRSERQCYVWDHAEYFQALTDKCSSLSTAKDPLTALEAVEKTQDEAVFVLRDFHQCLKDQPRIIRKLRSLAQKLKYSQKTIILTMPPLVAIPDELGDDIVHVDFPLPDTKQLIAILKKLLATPGTRMKISKPDFNRLIQAALGLSSSQAQRVFSRAIVSNGVLDARDIEMIREAKESIVRKSGALELFSPRETIMDIGGLGVLKHWLTMRQRAFTPEAQKYGLPMPKGIALIGIPGTGKSLTAKMIANLWGISLIRLDIGALFGSLVGQSEENARQALKLAEAVSPCVLWIDEIEKALATGFGDSGTSMRVFGTILSWMQEKTKPVFIVATANNIALLPPELLRRGRFDEIFFLDLPTAKEREEIFKVHIAKRNRQPENFDIPALAQASAGYVGAEIEQAVIEAMYVAFNDPQQPGREFTTADMLKVVDKMVPLSKSQREIVESLRGWLLDGRAQSASFEDVKDAKQEFVNIQLEPR